MVVRASSVNGSSGISERQMGRARTGTVVREVGRVKMEVRGTWGGVGVSGGDEGPSICPH